MEKGVNQSVGVAEEQDDASPDDVEPCHLVPEHPPEPPSSSCSSPALPLLAAATPRLVRDHPGRMDEQRHGGRE